MNMNKDWMDAVREQCLSEEGSLPPEGWSQIGHKMRRATTLRRSAMAVAVLVPVAALLLWLPRRQPSFPEVTAPAPLAVIDVPPVFIETPVATAETPSPIKTIPIPAPKPVPASPETPPAPSDTAAVRQGSPPVIQVDSENSHLPTIDPFEPLSAHNPQQRPRFSLGMKVGAGTAHRDASVQLQSAPYLAGLAYLNSYLNTLNPGPTPGVKANSANTAGLGQVANQFFPESSTDLYHHDLPVSLGITFRMDVHPRAGIESGIEYTYLHSSVESVAGRLDQQLHFIGIPLRLDARLLSHGRFDLYAGTGVKAEKCFSASFGTVRCEEKRWQWSAEVFAGAQYGLWNRAHLFFQPELSYYFTGTDLLTYRSDHPLSFTLQAGLRFDL